MLARGQETPENHPLIAVRGFFYRLVRFMNGKIMDVGAKGNTKSHKT
jgi:hypothetical protein